MGVGHEELMTGGDMEVEARAVDDFKDPLREHLAASLGIGLDNHHDERNLLEEGLIDSMAVMELVAYIEEAFDLTVEDEEIIADNFRSLESMAAYVGYKKAGVEFVSQYVAGVREFVAQSTPPGAFVLLLNSGDDDLLQVPDRLVWPFPCDEQGTRGATGHPTNGPEAIAMIDRLREVGATHIVFLEPELWWLDYYDGLRAHLEQHGRPGVKSLLGVAYALSGSAR